MTWCPLPSASRISPPRRTPSRRPTGRRWPATPNIRRRTARRALKRAVQRKFRRDHGLDYALDEICVSNGGKQVMFNALMATVDEGDEVVIPAPCWAAYTADRRSWWAARRCTWPARRTTASGCGPRTWKRRSRRARAGCCSTTRTTRPAPWPRAPSSPRSPRCCCSHPQVWIMSDDMYEHLDLCRGALRHAGRGGAAAAGTAC